MKSEAHQEQADFDHLTPDVVLDLVEAAVDARCTSICRPLNSYINRVYEVEIDDGEVRAVIAKFYRPGRWGRDALQDEHDFLHELTEREIPVIAPLAGSNGQTLFQHEDTYYALFPKKSGRICDEPDSKQWRELGRLLARMHLVGAHHSPRDRVVLSPRHSMTDQLASILASGQVPREHSREYEDVARSVLDMIAPLFEDAEQLRIHGDCHPQNIILRPGESFYMIDFDDMAMGPPVQDIWMLLPGRLQDSIPEMDLLLEGYETFRPFEHASLKLIEPLRAMRYIHFTAWCARQVADGGFAKLDPGWGTPNYWEQEIHELRKQQVEISDALDAPNYF